MTDIFSRASEKEMGEFFARMTNDQAKEFFDEYVRLRDIRLGWLNKRFESSDRLAEKELDFTPESLTPLWRWAMKHVRRRDHSDAELKHIMCLPDWFRESQLASKPLSEESLELLNDIAYYFAEVFVRNRPGVNWTVCKTKIKRHADRNQPVLAGFQVPMNPRDLVKVAAVKTLDGRAGDDELFRLYTIWNENLAKRNAPKKT